MQLLPENNHTGLKPSALTIIALCWYCTLKCFQCQGTRKLLKLPYDVFNNLKQTGTWGGQGRVVKSVILTKSDLTMWQP